MSFRSTGGTNVRASQAQTGGAWVRGREILVCSRLSNSTCPGACADRAPSASPQWTFQAAALHTGRIATGHDNEIAEGKVPCGETCGVGIGLELGLEGPAQGFGDLFAEHHRIEGLRENGSNAELSKTLTIRTLNFGREKNYRDAGGGRVGLQHA